MENKYRYGPKYDQMKVRANQRKEASGKDNRSPAKEQM